MQKIKEQINALLKKFSGKLHPSVYLKQGMRPSRDWLFIIYVFFGLFIVVSVLASILYISVANGTFWSSQNTNTSSKVYNINQNKLKIVNDYFVQKTTNLKNGPKPTPDPSL